MKFFAKKSIRSSVVFFSFLLFFVNVDLLKAQVLISLTPADIDTTAILKIGSMTKGLLPPRMNAIQRDAIVDPIPGLMIYCTDCIEMQVFTDTAWTNMLGMPAKDAWVCGDSIQYHGQYYTTVKVGSQCWMSENLNVGTMIPGVNPMTDNNIIDKYCYDDDPAKCEIYGGLYQWDEMMKFSTTEGTQGICPLGWHLPSDGEWKDLEMELGMSQIEADDTGFRGTNEASQLGGNEMLWFNGNLDGNVAFGTSGFIALPGGFRTTAGLFEGQSFQSYFWSSSLNGATPWVRNLIHIHPDVFRSGGQTSYGFVVRCIMD